MTNTVKFICILGNCTVGVMKAGNLANSSTSNQYADKLYSRQNRSRDWREMYIVSVFSKQMKCTVCCTEYSICVGSALYTVLWGEFIYIKKGKNYYMRNLNPFGTVGA